MLEMVALKGELINIKKWTEIANLILSKAFWQLQA